MAPVAHEFIPLHTNVLMHCVTSKAERRPARGTVVLVHGFPDTSHGWRHIVPRLSDAGYDVYAPDTRGYADTKFMSVSRPLIHEDFCMEAVVGDLVALLDALGLERAILVGHDWGGTQVWNFAAHHPTRLQAVASFCTPFFPANAAENPWVKMNAPTADTRFDYQLWFQHEPAIAELNRDTNYTTRCMLRAIGDTHVAAVMNPDPPRKRGGLLVGHPLDIAPSSILSPTDVAVYARQFAAQGFRGPVYYYRNVERNWQWNNRVAGVTIAVPALMVTAELDYILKPSMTKGMAKHVPNVVVKNVEGVGHWLLQEKPLECAAILIDWLQALPSSARL